MIGFCTWVLCFFCVVVSWFVWCGFCLLVCCWVCGLVGVGLCVAVQKDHHGRRQGLITCSHSSTCLPLISAVLKPLYFTTTEATTLIAASKPRVKRNKCEHGLSPSLTLQTIARASDTFDDFLEELPPADCRFAVGLLHHFSPYCSVIN